MVRLATEDRPTVLCLQEVPVWALGRLGEWSGMSVHGEVAAPPRLGPLPSTAELGRAITAVDQGLFRSAFSGQANAILVDPALEASDYRHLVLNDTGFRRAQAKWLGLDLVARLAWAKERRVCQVLRVAGLGLVANFHATGLPDDRIPDAEVFRAASFADGLSRPGEVSILAGDFNVRPERSRTLADLPAWGFSEPGDAIDQVLVRGAVSGRPARWPVGRRQVAGRVLSDHSPVEVELE